MATGRRFVIPPQETDDLVGLVGLVGLSPTLPICIHIHTRNSDSSRVRVKTNPLNPLNPLFGQQRLLARHRLPIDVRVGHLHPRLGFLAAIRHR